MPAQDTTTRIPDALIAELRAQHYDGHNPGWPHSYDQHGDQWEDTGRTHDGDRVMMPCYDPDESPILRRDLEATRGPLTEDPPDVIARLLPDCSCGTCCDACGHDPDCTRNQRPAAA